MGHAFKRCQVQHYVSVTDGSTGGSHGRKDLGLTLSNDLEWSKHIATMTNKANSKLLFLRLNLKGCPKKLKQTAYLSLIRSFMEYDITEWDPYQKYNSDKAARSSKVDIQDTLVFLICLMCWGGRLFLKEDRRGG